MYCGVKTVAHKRYQKRMWRVMACYIVVVLGAAWIVKHEHPLGWQLYFWSLLPAIPVILSMGLMGLYLHEETDEYQRVVMVRSLLVGTAALLGTLVVNDFLRSFAATGALPPFVCFVLFYAAFGTAQAVQSLRDRVRDE
jgi:hypothetical protein